MNLERLKRELLETAARRPLAIHRYRWGQDAQRRLTRRMRRDGLLVLVESTPTHLIYRKAKDKP